MAQFTEIDSHLLTQKAYAELKDAILKKTLAPGQKLDIFVLAEQFGISRTPIKEAFNRLHHDGLIVIKPRKGTFVAEMSKEDMIELLDARLMLECWAARESCARAEAERIDELDSLAGQMEGLCKQEPFDFMKYNELDIQFHETIVRLANNRRILLMYQGLHSHWMTARGYYEVAYEKAYEGYMQHRDIVEAYRSRSLSRLLEAVTAHIVGVKKDLVKIYDR
ncbi:MAG: GntR family transcriptional regulator [Paenibacillus sp.]|jgi:DNA-binding GntR family transcriptional regulator|nr:GntR family transcriptional regulator [Paenibacillus sp.]